MKKTKVISVLVKPLNNRELDSPTFVYEKIKSIIDSCKSSKQVMNCADLVFMYSQRFPEHEEFYRMLRDRRNWTFDSFF